MNWKRGLFRLWLVASCVWLVAGLFLTWDGLTAVYRPTSQAQYDCLAQSLRGREYDCLLKHSSPERPDWAERERAAIKLLAPPVVAPIVLLVLFWLCRLALRLVIWIWRGFRQPAV